MILRLALTVLRGARRSFGADARLALAANPAYRVIGLECIPQSGPLLVTINHYSRPGFGAWWSALTVSAHLPEPMHWIMTAEWTLVRSLGEQLLSWGSFWALPRIARVYGFTSMPPMPPRPQDAHARGNAVRHVFAHLRTYPQAVVALSPEGRSIPNEHLGWPPPGAGRFILHLARHTGRVLPVGVCDLDGQICVRFGPVYSIDLPAALVPAEQDRWAARQVMQHIAALLPLEMHGEFAAEGELTWESR